MFLRIKELALKSITGMYNGLYKSNRMQNHERIARGFIVDYYN